MHLNAKLAARGGRPAGFDHLRIGRALSAVCMHGAVTTKGVTADIALRTSPLRPFIRLILPIFFAPSGFLVAGSLQPSHDF